MRSIREEKDIKGKRVLVRVDFNVPIKESAVANDFRIKKMLPAVNYLREAGARLVLASHIGSDGAQSLLPVYEYLQKELSDIRFAESIDEHARKQTETLGEGEVLLLENLRRDAGEEANDEAFAKLLASLGDIYVNEAFSSSHRSHASIVGAPKHLPAYAGLLFEREVEMLSKALEPERPFFLILGGAKIETKMPLVEKFLSVAENIFVYGALAHDIYRARGYEIGRSLHSKDADVVHLLENEKIVVPTDVVVANEAGEVSVKEPDQVRPDEIIWDAGPLSVNLVRERIAEAKFVLWNGPIGNFEKGFPGGTEHLAEVVAESPAFSVVGGGDTIAAISKLNIEEKFGFVSTGGGAMLSFLGSGTLPGIEALNQ